MSDIVFGVSLGLILFFLVIGFLVGLIRGVKRSAVHIAFVVVSILVAFFITRPIVNAVLGINFIFDGESMSISEYILKLINDNAVDLSNFDSASTFIQTLPSAIASPIVFMVVMILVYFVIDIIYLIVARIAFGKKKDDLAMHKAHRLPGGLVGIVEACLFVFVLFAPITSLTSTYSEILSQSSASAVQVDTQNGKQHLQTVGDILSENIPSEVADMLDAFNKSAIGRVCSIGGINNFLFDELSNIKVDGEKIHIREEIVTLLDSYDEFVFLYNDIVDENYENLDFSSFKKSITFVIENNLFKAVLSDTIGDVVVNFNQLDEDFIKDLPVLAKDIITTLQTRFSAQDFDAYSYLSNDLLKLLDIADTIIGSGRLGTFIDFEAGQDAPLADVLNMFAENTDILSSAMIDFVDLNLVKDTLPILLDYCNQTIQPNFENDQGLIVSLNLDISNEEFKSVITSLFQGENSILAQINNLQKNHNILGILETENVLDFILNIENLDTVLTDFGAILDDLNGLKLLNYTDSETGEQIKSFENILKITGIDVLGDTVKIDDGNTKLLEDYEDFFSYISAPIQKIADANLVDLIDENISFDAIVDSLTSAISGETEEDKDLYFLADILMPFYELDQASFANRSLKDMIFVQVTDLLKDNLGNVLDLSTTTETENYQTWEDRLMSVANIIDILNDGKMTSASGEENLTYLKYLISENVDYFELVKEMNKDGTIENLLNVVFGNSMYQPLNSQIFSILDEKIADFTTVYVETDISNLYTEKDSYINLICSIITYLDEGQFDSDDLTTKLTAIGEILNELKTSAHGGVLNEVFANLIWYMTGDVIDSENAQLYAGKTSPFEYTDKVKEYLDAESLTNGYYDIDYLAEIEGLVDFIELGNQIVESLNQVDLSSETGRTQFVQDLDEIVHSLGDNAQEIVDTAVDIVNVVLTDEQLGKIQAQSADVITAITDYVSESGALTDDIKSSLLELFGLNQQ